MKVSETVWLADSILEALGLLIAAKESVLIGIDGINGSGKTSLAKKLASKLDASRLSLDDFIQNGDEEYSERINRYGVKKAIQNSNDSPLIVEGICLLAIAEQCDFSLDRHIYIKPYEQDDENNSIMSGSVEAIESKKREDDMAYLKLTGKKSPAGSYLGVTLAKYHRVFCPLQKADYIVDFVAN